MNAQEWEYSSEGKIKIAFTYIGYNPIYIGKTLILWKGKRFKDRNAFSQDVMMQLLSDLYIFVKVEPVMMSPQFLQDIIPKLQKKRPKGRVNDDLEFVLDSVGELQPNCSGIQGRIPAHVHSCENSGCVSVEIKVKCGLKSSSPFIPENRLVKLQLSRFRLMQCYKYSKAKRTEDGILSWGKFKSPSIYMPEDLCSSELPRIRQSLRTLLATPQNNIRISVDGKHFYGWDKAEDGDLHESLARCSSSLQFEPENKSEQLVDLIAGILVNESVLAKLLVAQDLDVLDVEGCAVVYQRVILLCGGSETAAGDYLNIALALPLDKRLILKEEGYFTASDGDSIEDIGINTVFQLRRLRVTSYTSPEVRQRNRSAAIELVMSASLDTCGLLLQLFMIALVAKDASVMIAAQRAEYSPPSSPLSTSSSTHIANCSSAGSTQNVDTCGFILTPTGSNFEKQCCSVLGCYIYSVRVIDVDLKALDKLWRKDVEEDAVCSAALEMHGELKNAFQRSS